MINHSNVARLIIYALQQHKKEKVKVINIDIDPQTEEEEVVCTSNRTANENKKRPQGNGLKRGETHNIYRQGINPKEINRRNGGGRVDSEVQVEQTGEFNYNSSKQSYHRNVQINPNQKPLSQNHKEIPIQHQKICKDFSNGLCFKGRNCRFLHKIPQISESIERDSTRLSYKTPNSICRYYARGFCRNGDGCTFIHMLTNVEGNITNKYNKHISNTGPNSVPNKISSPKQICPQYEVGVCKNYDICKETYDHPRRCRDLLAFGECRRGNNCTSHHPKLCKNSVNNLVCMDQTCTYFHLEGTRRPKRNEENTFLLNNTREVNNTIQNLPQDQNAVYQGAQKLVNVPPYNYPQSPQLLQYHYSQTPHIPLQESIYPVPREYQYPMTQHLPQNYYLQTPYIHNPEEVNSQNHYVQAPYIANPEAVNPSPEHQVNSLHQDIYLNPDQYHIMYQSVQQPT